MTGLLLHVALFPLGTTHDCAIGQAGPSRLTNVLEHSGEDLAITRLSFLPLYPLIPPWLEASCINGKNGNISASTRKEFARKCGALSLSLAQGGRRSIPKGFSEPQLRESPDCSYGAIDATSSSHKKNCRVFVTRIVVGKGTV